MGLPSKKRTPMKPVEWRRAYVERRAPEMAKSGRYQDALDIERALSAKGYIEALEWLDRASMRDDLNRVCRDHFGKRGHAEAES